MSKEILAIAISTLVFALATAANAAGVDTTDRDAGIVAGRKVAMLFSATTIGAMKDAIDRGDDVVPSRFPARIIASWARAIPGMFPAGSDVGESKALPSVWSDRAGFERAAASYASEADKLATLAAAGDKPGFAAQWSVVRQTCNACHKTYRKPG